ncbi:MAG: DivIVA protein [Firmicutes bacterium ADurb.Bin099]|nr:MAG: DivIVA protein [Firmicutes bacterium ADurb.Bin099]
MIAFKGIKKVLFGYSKKDVIMYIELLNEYLNSRIAEKDRQVNLILEQNKMLLKRLEMLEKNKDDIALSLIHAKKKADNILADARKQADIILKDTMEEKERQAEQYKQVEEEFEEFRQSVSKVLKSFIRGAEGIKKDCDKAHKLNIGE